MRQYGGQNCTPNNTCSPTLRVSCCHSRARLASGWLAGLYREGVEPSGSLRKVSDHMVIPLSCPPDATQAPFRRILLARSLLFALVSGPCVPSASGADLNPPRLRHFTGMIGDAGETLRGSVFVDFSRWDQPDLKFVTSTGASCTGTLYSSPTHDLPYGRLTCSDGRVGKLTWGSDCADQVLFGYGELSGSQFRFDEQIPDWCQYIRTHGHLP